MREKKRDPAKGEARRASRLPPSPRGEAHCVQTGRAGPTPGCAGRGDSAQEGSRGPAEARRCRGGAGTLMASWECGGTGATSRPQGLERPEPPAFSEGWDRPLPTNTFILQGVGAGGCGGHCGAFSQRQALGRGMPLECPGPEELGSSGESRKEGGGWPGRDGKGSGGRSAEAPHPVSRPPRLLLNRCPQPACPAL